MFPAGSVEFDSALLMRGIDHEWHGREPLCAGAETTEEPTALVAWKRPPAVARAPMRTDPYYPHQVSPNAIEDGKTRRRRVR